MQSAGMGGARHRPPSDNRPCGEMRAMPNSSMAQSATSAGRGGTGTAAAAARISYLLAALQLAE
jgi:hypothetical protein